MAAWWYVLALVVLAAVGVLYLRARNGRDSRSRDDRLVNAPIPRDFKQDRETARLSRMSDEDRTWEAASLQRNQETQAWEQTAPRRR